MRPIKLTMTAFGPYGKKEEIDFTRLSGRNIFLITGPTGAGKTTVFDGISYAIYGEASGEDRDGESLRSQFADEDTLTSVELEFELRGKRYYIKRIPKQMKKKSRGEGFTEQKTDGEMEIYDEETVKVISGVSNVNDKINEIMGINYEQFKQIMMIPQGEFRKLLTSESKDREKVLQKIFGTEAYKLVEFKLTEMAKELRKNIGELNNKQIENINRIQWGENETLKGLIEKENKNNNEIIEVLTEEINSDTEKKQKVEKEILNKESLMAENQKKIYEGRENNKKFDEKIELENKLKLLEEEKHYIECEKERLSKGRKAANIKGTEESYVYWKKSLFSKEEELKKTSYELDRAKKILEEEDKKLKIEVLKEEERNGLLEKAALLKGYKEKVKNLEGERRLLKEISEELKASEKSKKEKKEYIDNLKVNINNLSDYLEKTKKSSEEYLLIKTELEKTLNISNKITNLNIENKRLIQIRNEYIKYKGESSEFKRLYQEAEDKFKTMEILFREGQAAFLAKELQEGESCPVCGSIHHPKLAKPEEGVPGEEDLKKQREFLEKAKAKYEESHEKYRDSEVKGKYQSDVINRFKEEYKELSGEDISSLVKGELTNFIEDKLKELEEKRKELEGIARKLEKEKNEEEVLSKELKDKKLLWEEEEKLFEAISEDYLEKSKAVEKKKGILNQIISDIPEELRSYKALEDQIDSILKQHDIMTNMLKKAQSSFNNSQINYEKLTTEKEALTKALKEAKVSLEEVELKLKAEIERAGFKDIEEYRSSKLSEEKEEKLENKIKSFNEEFKSKKDRYNILLKETKDLLLINLEELNFKYTSLKKDKELIEENKTELHTKIEINKAVLSRIKELDEEIKIKEYEYSIVGDLSETAKGNNSERMTFERYVLAAFFDDIIRAANIRLAKMSENRYELDRIKEKGKGLTQSGLELQVYDNYTGKYRHVKTLSGGEGFKASLSMALGLADVVQCYSGGISLDTMFIDEGFGTLDPESLDNAVQCLIDLQNTGRLVGIISHVPELKERIDARLEITPSAEGSTTRFNL